MKPVNLFHERPGAEVISSSFGGGWIIPLTPAGSIALADFFNEEPCKLAVLGGRAGYIVEPYQAGDLAEHLHGAGIAWRVR
jgi:hypothetical protein